jgi:flagellar biosynthesis/type III secretory pathway protein FliH
MFEQIVLILLLINALSIVLIVALVYIVDFRPYLKHISRMRANVDEQAKEILNQARMLGEQIVSEANQRSLLAREENEKLLKILEEKIKVGIEETISKSKEDIQNTTLLSMNLYKEQLNSLARKYNVEIEESKNEITKVVQDGLSRLLSSIEMSVKQLDQETKLKVQQEVEKVRSELIAEKEEKLKKTEEQIFQIINEIAKKVIGQSLDVAQHEKIVMEALEEIRREGTLIHG